MNCPVDQAELLMTERQGIEIDYCPKCRGVWLDRGELDKMIDRASPPAPTRDPERSFERQPSRSPERGDDDDDRSESRTPHNSRRKFLLGELFDFG